MLQIYDAHRVNFESSLSEREIEEFDVERFLNRARYVLSGADLRIGRMEEIYQLFDRSRIEYESMFDHMGPSAFAVELNRETLVFQENMAESLRPDHYEALFNRKPGEFEVLVDPDFVEQVSKQ